MVDLSDRSKLSQGAGEELDKGADTQLVVNIAPVDPSHLDRNFELLRNLGRRMATEHQAGHFSLLRGQNVARKTGEHPFQPMVLLIMLIQGEPGCRQCSVTLHQSGDQRAHHLQPSKIAFREAVPSDVFGSPYKIVDRRQLPGAAIT